MDMDEDKWIGLMDRHRHTQRHTHMMDGLMDGWHTTEWESTPEIQAQSSKFSLTQTHTSLSFSFFCQSVIQNLNIPSFSLVSIKTLKIYHPLHPAWCEWHTARGIPEPIESTLLCQARKSKDCSENNANSYNILQKGTLHWDFSFYEYLRLILRH